MKDKDDKELSVCCVSGKSPYECNCFPCRYWRSWHCVECGKKDKNCKKAYSMDEDEGKEGYLCPECYEELVEV